MSEGLLRWWPALPAALILYLSGADFVEHYPHAQVRPSERLSRGVPDSLLALARAFAADTAQASVTEGENPFRPIHAPKLKGQGGGGAVHLEPPPRKYVLNGTVGRDVATIANAAGQRIIVKVGDRIDSAEVISIEPNRVILKDRAGKFEIQTEK